MFLNKCFEGSPGNSSVVEASHGAFFPKGKPSFKAHCLESERSAGQRRGESYFKSKPENRLW